MEKSFGCSVSPFVCIRAHIYVLTLNIHLLNISQHGAPSVTLRVTLLRSYV